MMPQRASAVIDSQLYNSNALGPCFRLLQYRTGVGELVPGNKESSMLWYNTEKQGYGMTASWILPNHPYVTESSPGTTGHYGLRWR
jgi:hypothetical protein